METNTEEQITLKRYSDEQVLEAFLDGKQERFIGEKFSVQYGILIEKENSMAAARIDRSKARPVVLVKPDLDPYTKEYILSRIEKTDLPILYCHAPMAKNQWAHEQNLRVLEHEIDYLTKDKEKFNGARNAYISKLRNYYDQYKQFFAD